jgi:UDP-glucose 4-epimerase
MKKILITGCAGFIGSRLTMHLLKKKYKILGIDDLSTGNVKNLNFKNKNFFFIKGDCNNKNILSKIKGNIQIIIHLAGQSSGELSFYNPKNDLNRNFLTTINLLEFYKEKKCKQFIYTSSMSVYGNSKSNPVNEKNLCSPVSFYGQSKLCSENYIKLYSKHNINYSILRLFNVYGPGQLLNSLNQGLIRIYLNQIFNTNKLYIKGSKNRFRDFIYIDDVTKIIELMIENKKCFNQVFNLGYGKKYFIKNLVKLLKEKIKKKFKVKYISGTPLDQFGIYSDSNKIFKAVNYSPTIDLDRGLDFFIESLTK